MWRSFLRGFSRHFCRHSGIEYTCSVSFRPICCHKGRRHVVAKSNPAISSTERQHNTAPVGLNISQRSYLLTQQHCAKIRVEVQANRERHVRIRRGSNSKPKEALMTKTTTPATSRINPGLKPQIRCNSCLCVRRSLSVACWRSGPGTILATTTGRRGAKPLGTGSTFVHYLMECRST